MRAHFVAIFSIVAQADVDAIEKLGIQLEQNVRRALSEGQPVVALESTIISHGMYCKQFLLHSAIRRRCTDFLFIPFFCFLFLRLE